MDKTQLYVKKIFIFILVSIATYLALEHFDDQGIVNYFVISLALLTISLLHLGFAGIKPPFLFTLDKSDQFINGKNGFFMFLKPLLILVGFAYDIVVWTIWGIYLIYEFILDIFQLLKTILYWIFFAILWFLKLFVPPIKLIYFWVIHYLIKWPWWLYKQSFVNINNAFKRNYYFISVWGAVLALETIFIFYYLAVITGIIGFVAIGAILSVLPISWSFGEIANVKKENLVPKPYWEVRKSFGNGMESVRNVLIYMVIFLSLSVIMILFDLLGWIPKAGYSLMGFTFNLNILIAFVLIVLSFVISFASFILPTNLLYGGKSQPDFTEMISQLSIIFRRCLRYMFVWIPSGLFGTFVLIIPAILFAVTMGFAIQVKNNVLDTKINLIEKTKNRIVNEQSSYEMAKKIEQLKLYKEYPFVEFNKLILLDALKDSVRYYNKELGYWTDQREKNIVSRNEKLTTVSDKLDQMQQITNPEAKLEQSALLNDMREGIERVYNEKDAIINLEMAKRKIDIEYANNYRTQTYITFFFAGIGIAFFAGFVLAFFISFLGNIYFDLFHFKEDGKPVYLMQKVYEENEKDSHQPLIGFTLLIIAVLIFIFIRPIFSYLKFFLVF